MLLRASRQTRAFLHLVSCCFGVLIEIIIKLIQDVSNLFTKWLRINPVFFVIRNLLGATSFSFVDRVPHGIRDGIGIHVYFAADVTGSTANRLDERCTGTEEPFLIRIKNCNERDFRKVQTFTEKVDTDEYIVGSQPQLAQ